MATDGIKVNMTPSHPGDFIRTEVIEELGLNVTKAAEILGVRRATLSDLLNGNAALSPEMALRIEKAFAVSMDMLLRMQAWYDASQMRARAKEIKVRRYGRRERLPPPLRFSSSYTDRVSVAYRHGREDQKRRRVSALPLPEPIVRLQGNQTTSI